MQAQDIMTVNVITVEPDAGVQEIAKRLIENRISAVPVVERNGKLIGIVSEGDLLRRTELDTERHPSWWFSLLTTPEESARMYVKTHGRHAADVMTRKVITVNAESPIQDIAETLERKSIKRVPVMRGDKIIGIVSRSNLLRGLAAQPATTTAIADDREIKASVEKAMLEAGVRSSL